MEDIFDRVKLYSEKPKSLSSEEKNRLLIAFADALIKKSSFILDANASDVTAAKKSGLSSAMIDRLSLNEKRIGQMSEGLKSLALLPDPIGETAEEWTAESGVLIKKTRIPIGVIGIIYEARPNVTSDVLGICLKTGNACVLKGGKEAYSTNLAVLNCFSDVSGEIGKAYALLPPQRDATDRLIKAKGKIDLVIPRGGKGLINYVKENAAVPFIETGAGVCHLYVEKSADEKKALDILLNAKCSRPSVCNAVETLLVDRDIAEKFIPKAMKVLAENGVKFHGNAEIGAKFGIEPSDDDVYFNEYDDLEISLKIVNGAQDAVSHIKKYGTKHSECICTENNAIAEYFMNSLDSACVYRNASTRFTDGGCFGFGAEIGISTQMLHARGPMGLKEMTTYHYKIYGDGQVRK
ncbi:MAG TPA: glutamate-5-semialdehyde dehydrogenase [Clostridiales bacterium]|nr:glutamate-5-semialdehyde dehydrogenase [Clostridiales bacterium]